MRSLLKNWGTIVANPKTRWMTFFIWILFIGVFSYIWPQVNDRETPDNQLLPETAMSVEANKISKEEFSDDIGVPLLLVWHREEGLQPSDYEMIQQLYQNLDEHPIGHQSFVPPFQKVPVEAIENSASTDGRALITPVFFDESASIKELQTALDQLGNQIAQQFGDEVLKEELEGDSLHVRFSGPVGIQTDAVALFSNADVTLLIATVLIVFILLILLYRSPILAIVPLVAVGIAYGIISPILGFFADKQWITVDGQAISIMTVLLFGAGTDYCLFLISRYRDELRRERDKYIALKHAISGTGGAIMMSSLTTVLGMLSLGLAYYASYDRFAVPFSLSIFIMGIAALTLLPAILALLGRIAFIPFIPRTEEMMQEIEQKKRKKIRRPKPSHRFGMKLGGVVTNKPWTIIVISTIVLSTLAAFVPKMQFTYGLLESFPEDMPSREGFTLIENHYPPGEIAPVKMIVNTSGEAIELKEALEIHPYVEEVRDPIEGSTNKNLQQWEFTLSINPYATQAVESIPELKEIATKALQEAGVPNAEEAVWIGGETATLYDTDEITSRDQSIIIPVLLVIIAVLLFVYLKSIVATAYLLATVLLSYFSALGLGWIVLHHFFGFTEIQGLIPLYAFVFLVVLGEDYNIFLVSSIWQKRKHMPLKQAIAESVGETGSVISSAGLILAGTFSVLAVLPLQVLVHFGTITAIGILLDTFIVRPLLVPAITTVLGRYAFWPGKMWKLKNDESYTMQGKDE
ncbi:MMPL family transporter [Sporosarcina pasteurii]|uniref:Membrane protein ydgH n=1 Tax=Sporosarcina pasteurii TaxID=1474 RepID=A0A380BQQ7_SPOPA|nr:MMPL family transporter [Sporosarcina pasteurii]MDS9471171.1 MMPL family transporter [Sporosarcina pasteurii]QBQ05190.1 MMPL family transporter [Sporosarcina pasteurii]SUJ05407.1 Putative membrane protein ydgH [Sporosarcina pasteurii]